MDLGLKGRVAVITGGSKGIGRAVACTLAKEGVSVIVSARQKKALDDVCKQIIKEGGKAAFVCADVSVPQEVNNVIEQAIEQFGGLDILVNNAGGVDRFGGLLDINDEDWKNAFDVNVMGLVYFVRQALPALKKSKSPRIINISSISGVQPGICNPHYTTVKAAVVNLSKYIANEFAKDKILTNVICAGPVHSSFWDRNVEYMARQKNLSAEQVKQEFDLSEAEKIPLGRVGEADDVASLVAFLASDQASWITGGCFHVDGGKYRAIS